MRDAIVITISASMLKEKGYKNWLRNFLQAMNGEDWIYYMRQGSQPKQKIMWVYLCIGGKIRFRANFIESHGPGKKTFSDGTSLSGRAWILLAGPVTRAPRKEQFPMKGFRGFRYTDKIF